MFYRLDKDNNIVDCADYKYSDDCLETDKNIIRNFNGKLIFEEFTLTEEYLSELKLHNDKLNDSKQLLELTNWFDTYFKMQLEQHSWQKDYKPSIDPYFKNEDGSAKTYETFEDIIAQAEIVREEIKKLRS